VTGLASDCAGILRAIGSPSRLVSDSRRVSAGDAFAAYPGERTDGRRFIPQALAQGASGVLWEPAGFAWDGAWTVANHPVPGLKQRLGELADRVYGHPSRHLWMIGVTGTNGKTSCSQWIAQALARSGRRSAVLGTLGNGLVGEGAAPLASAENTTMDAALLQETLAALRAGGAETVAMEVSSHGLAQGRVNGTRFDVALFTNLSRDHLDYHGTMEAYFAAKARLFEWPGLGAAVINVDDAHGRELARRAKAAGRTVIGYGLESGDVSATAIDFDAAGFTMEVRTPWGSAHLRAALSGTFNASNVLGVLGVLGASRVTLADAVAAIAELRPPPGRMQRLGGGGVPTVVVDYAHTPDALEKVLGALRPTVTQGGRLVCVFGCGGDRDRGKRPEMGRVAEAGADRVVVTSDNPRSEDPLAILADIAAGIAERRTVVFEVDRGRAIDRAIAESAATDVVLIAGKGHEPYQEIGGVRHAFDDVARALATLGRWRPADGARR
jgi:UDP-N-acetylmuramoyl-L-alanyl-D-glutamate--2,6-diaminopimelate ligase